jgi:transcriptional regulator with XRE-family HTH domain
MDKANRGRLSNYVKRVMQEKGLTQRDVEARSGDKITDGYVADILRGASKNPSVEKLIALAHGIGVDPHELFAIACSAFEIAPGEPHSAEPPSTIRFLEIMQVVAESPELTEIVQGIIRLAPGERTLLQDLLTSLNERGQESEASNRRDGTDNR